MLKLSEQQLHQLDELEKQQYVDEVHKTIVAEHPPLAADAELQPRLQMAYREAVSLGFTEGPAITQFLHYEAFAPGFHREPAVRAWLAKPGASAEQRFSDLVQVMRARTREV